MAGPLNKRIFIPTAPIKGSFPLDHEHVCKEKMIEYMLCVSKNKSQNELCREQAKTYFNCRMENNLMRKEDWVKLGYGDIGTTDPEQKKI